MNVALITGGSRGLGFALASSLAEDGWEVVLDGRDPPALATAADTIGARAHVVAGDVGDPVHRTELIERVRGLGRLDLLVNNASTLGPTPMPPLRDLDPRDLLDIYSVNVAAPLALTQLALPLLAAVDGAVINVTSDAAVEAYAGWGGYGSSKAALEQLSHVLAAEEDVRVWWVDPGDMRTQMHQDAFPGEDISDRPEPAAVVPALRRLIEARSPSGRVRAVEVTTSASGVAR